ncbi:MAG: transcriptional regulator [Clostridiaceae bacterium]|jgi:DNA-binding transcriptional MerR regulator|nr:transcriptional regulator [Clostridiaceae bacterium]
MKYTISEAAKKTNLTTHTIRYYDKEGLLPFVERTESGIRYFTENDMEGLAVINCLKATGMPIKEIKIFMDWCVQGDSTLKERYNMFLERKSAVQNQIEELQKALDKINYKCWYYKTAMEAKTENIHHTSQEPHDNLECEK